MSGMECLSASVAGGPADCQDVCVCVCAFKDIFSTSTSVQNLRKKENADIFLPINLVSYEWDHMES